MSAVLKWFRMVVAVLIVAAGLAIPATFASAEEAPTDTTVTEPGSVEPDSDTTAPDAVVDTTVAPVVDTTTAPETTAPETRAPETNVETAAETAAETTATGDAAVSASAAPAAAAAAPAAVGDPTAVLALTKSDNAGPAGPQGVAVIGDAFQYTITAACSSNTEVTCTDTVLTDTVPAPLEIVGVVGAPGTTATFTGSTVTITWPAPGLTVGSAVSATISVKFPNGTPDGVIVAANTAEISASNASPTIGTDRPIRASLVPAFSSSAAKTWTPNSGIATSGQSSAIKVAAANTSNKAVDAIVITEPNPATNANFALATNPFNWFEFDGFGAVVMPTGADRIQVDVVTTASAPNFITGQPSATATLPTLPGTQTAADVIGYRVTFTKDGGQIPASGAPGSLEIKVVQLDTSRSGTDSAALNGDLQISNQLVSTVVAVDAPANSATAAAPYTIIATLPKATGSKSVDPTSIAQGDTRPITHTIAVSSTSPTTLQEFTIVDPTNAADPYSKLAFTGFGTVTPPAGATGVQISLRHDGSGPTSYTSFAAANADPNLSDVKGYTITWTGTIAKSATATVPVTSVLRPGVATGPISNCADLTIVDSFTQRAAVVQNMCVSMQVTDPTFGVNINKVLSPGTGSLNNPPVSTTATLSATVTGNVPVGSVTIFDPNPAPTGAAPPTCPNTPAAANDCWYDMWDVRSLKPAVVPSGVTMTAQGWNGSAWVQLGSAVNGPATSAAYTLTAAERAATIGLRFVFTPIAPATTIATGTTVQATPLFVYRLTTRSGKNVFALIAANNNSYPTRNCASSSVTLGNASAAAADPSCKPFTTTYTPGPGSGIDIKKVFTDNTATEQSRETVTATVTASYTPSSVGDQIDTLVILDAANPSSLRTQAPIQPPNVAQLGADSFYDAFDLRSVRNNDNSPRQTATLEIFNGTAWTSLGTKNFNQTWTLTTAQSASTVAARITMERAIDPAFDPEDQHLGGPSHPFAFTWAVRDTLRSTPNPTVLSTTPFNTTDADPAKMEALNVASTWATCTYAGCTQPGKDYGTASYSDTAFVLPGVLNVAPTIAWAPASVAIPAGNPPAASYPTTVLTLTAENANPIRLDQLQLDTAGSPNNPFGPFAFTGLTVTSPTGAASFTVVVTGGPAAGTYTGATGLAALNALPVATLDQITGVTVVWGNQVGAGHDSDIATSVGAPNGNNVGKAAIGMRLRDKSLNTYPLAGTSITARNTVQGRDITGAANQAIGGGVYQAQSFAEAPIAIVPASTAVALSKSFAPKNAIRDLLPTASITLSTANSGNVPLTSLVVTDSDPETYAAFDLVGFTGLVLPNGAATVRIDALTSAGWQNGTPATSAALPTGVSFGEVIGVRFTFAGAAGGSTVTPDGSQGKLVLALKVRRDLRAVTGSTLTSPTGTTVVPLGVASSEGVAQPIVNTATAVAFDGVTASAPLGVSDTFTLLAGAASVKIVKLPGGSYNPGEIVPFTIDISNTGTADLGNLRVVDPVPSDMDYDQFATFAFNGDTDGDGIVLPAPTRTAIPGADPTLVDYTWPAGTTLRVGQSARITLPLRVAPATAANTEITNIAGISADSTAANAAAPAPATCTGAPATTVVTGDASLYCPASTKVTVQQAGGFVSYKESRGNDGARNSLDPSAACPTTADGYVRYPCAARSFLGSTGTSSGFRYTVQNSGNVPASTVTSVDVLPWIGDHGVSITGINRNSAWMPILNAVPTVAGPANSTSTLYYSASSNPCTAEITGGTCPAGAWSTTMAPGLVRSIKVVTTFDGVFAPGATITTTLFVDTPNQLPAGVNPTAWNSFAFGSSIESNGTLNVFGPVEPQKAGLLLGSADLTVKKTLAGAAAAYGSTAVFTGSVTCTQDGHSVDISPSTFSLSAANGFSQTLAGLPLDATCVVHEIATGGADTPAPDQTVQLGETVNVVTLTNTFNSAPLTLRKIVSGAGAAFSTRDFVLSVTCSFNGQPILLPAGDDADPTTPVTVTLPAAGGTQVITGLPIGAVCTMTEPDTNGATAATFATANAAVGSTTATSATVTIGAGTGAGTSVELIVDNRFDTGSLSVAKIVDGPGAGASGNGPFTIAVTCSFQSVVLPVRTFTIMGGATRTETGLPVGATCAVAETATGGATHVTTLPTNGTVVITGTGTAVALVGVTNTFNVGDLDIVKVRTGDGATLYGAGPFTVRLTCTWLVDGVNTSVPLPNSGDVVLDEANGYAATIEGLPTNAVCSGTETSTGGANTASVSSAVTIGEATTVTLTATNTFRLGSLQITKVRTGPGAAANGVGPFTVEITCARLVDGQPVPVVLDDDREVQLAAPDYSVTIDDLPVGAVCSAVETDAGGATSSVVSAPVTIAAATAPVATITVTNDFQVGMLTLTKVRAGEGAPLYGAGTFEFELVCSGPLGDTTTSSLSETVVLTFANGYSQDFGPLPTGAICSAEETATGGANTTEVSGPVTIGSGDSVTITATNTFDIGDLEIVKVRTGEGADLWGAGPFEVSITCRRDVDGDDTDVAIPGGPVRQLSADNDYHVRVVGLPVGATCAVTETDAGLATGDPVVTEAVDIGSDPVQITVTNDFAVGSIVVRKSVEGNAPAATTLFGFTLECTVDGSPLELPATSVAFSITAGESKRITVLAGASCTLTEVPPAGVVDVSVAGGSWTGTVTDGGTLAFDVLNSYPVSLVVTKAIGGLEPVPGAAYAFSMSCEDDDGAVALPASDAAFTLVGGGSKTVGGLALGTACIVTETESGGATNVRVAVGAGSPVASATATVVLSDVQTSVGFVNEFSESLPPLPTTTTTTPVTPTVPANSPPLPRTGGDVADSLLVGLLVLVAGGVLVAVARRRRQPTV